MISRDGSLRDVDSYASNVAIGLFGFYKGRLGDFFSRKMSETTYQKVFEFIQSTLVPKIQYDELQKKFEEVTLASLTLVSLKSELELAKNEWKSKFEEQKLRVHILQAEKESLESEKQSQYDESQKEVASLKSELESVRNEWKSKFEEQKLAMDILQAEKESMELEKKTSESKFKEVSLKLKQKNHHYDSLLRLKGTGSKQTSTAKASASTQTIKEELNQIGIVNVPTSLSSHPNRSEVKTGTKRSNSNLDNDKTRIKKRKKSLKSDNAKRTTKKSLQTQQKFSCHDCFSDWARSIKREFSGDPTQNGAPDPKQKIPTFTSFENYRNHCISVHAENIGKYINDPCRETSCLLDADHRYRDFWPHGDMKCEICSLSFKLKEDNDRHMRSEHVDIDSMNSKEIYELYRSNKSFP